MTVIPARRSCYRAVAILAGCLTTQSPVATADVHKWVDEKGVTHYSEKPPAGRTSTSLGIQTPATPATPSPRQGQTCQTVQCQYERLRRDRLADDAADRAERELRSRQAAARIGTRGMSFDVFARLDRGMSEAEVMQRAGPPDYEAFDGARGAKTWSYYPTGPDPFTTSVILRGGRVFEILRVRQ